MVDYRATSRDFWAIVGQYNPIAIMSFSRGNFDKSWELEGGARNLYQTQDLAPPSRRPTWWGTNLSYLDSSNAVVTETWLPPHAGGSAEDFSPYRGLGTIAGNPPDRSIPVLSRRDSTLPMDLILEAVGSSIPFDRINPWIDSTGDVGAFVSEYMAYHVAWYRDYSMQVKYPNDPTKQCLRAGHTHVGAKLAIPDAEAAVEIQLEQLFRVLP